MVCPECGSASIRPMVRIPSVDGLIWRRKYCYSCGKKFKTYETVAGDKEPILPDDECEFIKNK